MSHYIGQDVKTCDLCLHTKAQQSLPVRELSPLPTLESHWDKISIDFTVELPESHSYDGIMNVVDSVSKVSHFIPTHNNHCPWGSLPISQTHLEAAWTSKTGRFRPRSAVHSRVDVRALHLLGIKLAATMAYHPQGDRQTEWVNQELDQYLHLFVNERQDDWDELLLLAEFQYNNHIHSATQQTPFMLDSRRHLWMGFEPHQAES